jgi:hypothetical protein
VPETWAQAPFLFLRPPMNENVDVYVCHPDLGINKSLEGVFIQFEVMDPSTMAGTGKSHTVAMTTSDAMRLLKTLDQIQKMFSLPIPQEAALLTEIGPTKKPS